MKKRLYINRTSDFKWESRQELYDYFKDKYNLTKEQIDEEIELCRKKFAIRKGQVIRPQELWQKTGCTIEERLA